MADCFNGNGIKGVDMLDKKDKALPPRPGEESVQKKIEGIPFNLYINGQPVSVSKIEALGIMSQILNIMTYLEGQEPYIEQGNENG